MAGRGRLVVMLAVVIVGLGVGSEVVKLLTADTTSIEVASANIPVGTPITQSMVQTKVVHNDGVEPGAITSKKSGSIIGQYSTTAIHAGEQITSYNVNTGNGQSGMEGSIPKGDVGMNIPFDNITGLSSSLSTGDFVDILGSISIQSGTSKNVITNYIAENVPVLGVQIDPNNKSSVQGVRVAVTPQVASELEEILSLSNGSNNGDIRLVMPGYANRKMNAPSSQENVGSITQALQK